MKRQPFNDQNPNGPLELCTCATCGSPIMLDDKQHRIRVIVPNLMGYGSQIEPPAYHAFYNPESGEPKPSDGRPVYEGLRPEFVRSEEHTSELQSLMRISYAVFCLKKNTNQQT